MTDEADKTPPKKHPTRFHAWLDALHAHAEKMPKPRCLHGNPWDNCTECPSVR